MFNLIKTIINKFINLLSNPYFLYIVVILSGIYLLDWNIYSCIFISAMFILVYRMSLIEMYIASIFKVGALPVSIMVDGVIRSGKDLTIVAYSHLHTQFIKFRNFISKYNIRIKVRKINFSTLDNKLKLNKIEIKHVPEELINNYTIKFLIQLEQDHKKKKHLSDTYINVRTKRIMKKIYDHELELNQFKKELDKLLIDIEKLIHDFDDESSETDKAFLNIQLDDLKEKIELKENDIKLIESLINTNKQELIELTNSENIVNEDLFIDLNEQSYKLYLANCFTEKQYQNIKKMKYNNFISKSSYISMLQEYSRIFYVTHIRKSYTVSNMSIYDRASKQYSFMLKDSDLKLNQSNEYVLSQDLNIVLTEGNLIYPNYETKEEQNDFLQSGITEAFAIMGHLTKEKSKFFTSVQDKERPLKTFRTMMSSYHNIEKRFVIVGDFLLARKILTVFVNIFEGVNQPLRKLGKIKIFYFLELIIKLNSRLSYLFLKLHDFLYSRCYIKTYAKMSQNGTKEVKRFSTTTPARHVFGCYDTHFFSGIHEEKTNNSSNPLNDRVQFDDLTIKYKNIEQMNYKRLTSMFNNLGKE